MSHRYTRQRQGRDFPADEAPKTLQERLEEHKKEAERNAVPVDGHEPTPEHPAPEQGRI